MYEWSPRLAVEICLAKAFVPPADRSRSMTGYLLVWRDVWVLYPLGYHSIAHAPRRKQRMFGRNKTGVDVVQAQKMSSDDGYVILDVRTERERRQGHPPDSIHIVLETIPQRLDELKGKKVLAFCRSGNRSDAAARFLNQQDIEAHNVLGGILAWSRAGLPLKKGP